MRLQGRMKAGFYPTPLSVVDRIARMLALSNYGQHSLLDPTAGKGEALARLRERLRERYPNAYLPTYGIELERSRAGEAKKRLDKVYVGDARGFVAQNFSLLFLNPPYDFGDGERLEEEFLRLYAPALVPDGVLVYVIPERYIGQVARTLTSHFYRLKAWRFPEEEYAAFQQIVVFGLKRDEPVPPGEVREVRGELPADFPAPYLVPSVYQEPVVRRVLKDPGRLLELARRSPAWRTFWDAMDTSGRLAAFRPLAPLREGHLALLLAAGYLNSTVIETAEGRYVLKGRVEKVEVVEHQEDRTVRREQFRAELLAWNLDTGKLERLT